jgi:aminoglycoside phosphotransferase (APT) family kinase protein
VQDAGIPVREDQGEVAAGTVRRLIADQFPAWAGLDVREVRSAATTDAVFRVGDDLAARFPPRGGDPERLRRWLEVEAAAAREPLSRLLADVDG